MKSFKTSFSSLSLIGSSSTGITDASIIADQCSKVFDQLAALLTDLRSVSTPEIVLVIEQGIDKAKNSEIGKSLAETIRLYADNCSVTGRETIQSALSEATTCINTCCEIARKAQKKKKWDKDPQKKLEQNWFLFCREIAKISKLLPLSPVDLQLIHSLCNDDSDVGSVLEGKGHLGSYHTIESRHGAHFPTSSASRSRSSNRESSNGASTISGASQATRSSTRKLQKHKSHSTLASSPPAYSDIMKAKYDQKDDEEVDEVLPIVPAPRPSRSIGAIRPQGLFPSYPSNNYNPNTPLPQSVAFMGPMPPAILVPVFPQQYIQPQYPQQPQWPSPPPSAGVAYKSGSSITETVTKFALDIIHPELRCPCHIRHFGDHPRCWRNCCIWMGCV